MHEFDASSNDKDEFATYVGDVSGNAVTVCNKTYICRRLAEGDFWTADPKHDAEPASRACRLDVLAAAGHANSCDVRKTIQSTPEACTSDRPVLTNERDDLVQLRGNRDSNEMPSLLEGGWRCLAPQTVSATTHEPRHMERVGGLTFVHMDKRPDDPPPAETPPSPPEKSRPSTVGPDPVPDDGGWTRCPLPAPRPQPTACVVDQDCPLSPEQYKEILWAQVRDAKPTSFPGLLRHIRDNVSNDITWSAPTRARLTTKTQMKNALMNMFDTDAVFRASVTAAVDRDAEFADRRNAALGGSCGVQGKCKASTVVPRTRLFDGTTRDVVFTVLDDDATVTYTTPNGMSREVHAVKCTPATREACDRATEVDGATLRAGVTPLASSYRIRTSDTLSEFVVMNHISAKDPSRCNARLCELNQGSCPASSCTLDDEKRCVPL